MKALRSLALFLLAAWVVTGCAGSRTAKKTETVPAPAAETAAPAAPGEDAGVTETNIRGSEFGGIPDLAPVGFDYDRYALGEEARATLAKNSDFLKKNADFDVLLEGHCDERGTIEYNLALGQKRAQTIRDYYARLGIPAKRLGMISYGKEKPVCAESTEECWSRNRRGETKVRARTVSNHKAPPPQAEPISK